MQIGNGVPGHERLCGFKGERRGQVGIWQRQPLVFVNLGTAKGEDFLNLAQEVQQAVLDRFEVALQMEPRVLGEAQAPS